MVVSGMVVSENGLYKLYVLKVLVAFSICRWLLPLAIGVCADPYVPSTPDQETNTCW